MADKDAEATALLCFSSPTSSPPPYVRVCLGISPPKQGGPIVQSGPIVSGVSSRKYFFTINIEGVTVSLPNPLIATAPPVQGAVNLSETLRLSRCDLEAMQAWLNLVLCTTKDG